MIREAKITDSKEIKEIKEISTNDLGYFCDEELVRLRLSRLDNNRECVFVAEVEGQVAGFIHVEKYDLLYYKSMANILGLAVSSKFRRMGIGQKLMSATENWAKEREIDMIRLNSGEVRKEAHMFYRSLGFSDEKEQLRFVKKLQD